MNLRTTGPLAFAACALSACTYSTPAEAPATVLAAPAPAPALAVSGYTPVVSLNEIMVYVVDPHSNELWDAATKPPTSEDEAAWKALERGAVAIAAAGSLTKLSGNAPTDQNWTQQPDWAKYSQEVSNAGLLALKAVQAKDVSALSKAGDQLVLSCLNCHRQYKLAMPAIWTERPFPPEEKRP